MKTIRKDLVTLLQNLKNVTATRLDKVKAEDCPAISVLNIATTQNQIGHTLEFDASSTIGIILFVAKTTEYDDELDDLVASVLNTIFLDEKWQQQFESVPQFQISYDYDQAGETNLATAKILVTVVYTDNYDVVIEDDFSNLHFDIDLAEADQNIDAILEIDL